MDWLIPPRLLVCCPRPIHHKHEPPRSIVRTALVAMVSPNMSYTTSTRSDCLLVSMCGSLFVCGGWQTGCMTIVDRSHESFLPHESCAHVTNSFGTAIYFVLGHVAVTNWLLGNIASCAYVRHNRTMWSLRQAHGAISVVDRFFHSSSPHFGIACERSIVISRLKTRACFCCQKIFSPWTSCSGPPGAFVKGRGGKKQTRVWVLKDTVYFSG